MKMTAEAIRAHAMKHGLPCALDAVSSVMAQQPEPDAPPSKFERGEEKKLNALVVADLRRRGFFVIVSRTDRATSQQPGLPDVIAFRNGLVACCELKATGGKLSAAQKQVHTELEAAGVPVITAWDFDTAIRFFINKLGAIQ